MSKIKDFFKDHGDKIILTIGGILIAITAFGLGKLTTLNKVEPIEISNSNEIKDMADSMYSASSPQADGEDVVKNDTIKDTALFGKFLASVDGNKYFTASAAKLAEIGESKVIWFDSKEDAEEQGYTSNSKDLTDSTDSSAGTSVSEGQYVASKSGTKYYLPTCSGVSRIKDENKVWFDTVEDAEAEGLEPAANCPGLE